MSIAKSFDILVWAFYNYFDSTIKLLFWSVSKI